MPSYRDIRRRGLDGSGGSDDNSSTALDRYATTSAKASKEGSEHKSAKFASVTGNDDTLRKAGDCLVSN